MDNGDELRDVQKRVTHIEAVIPTLATKADVAELRAEMHEGFSGMVKWVVGTAIGLGVVGLTVMTFVLNNAVPKQTSSAQQAPIIINVPGQSVSLPGKK